MDDQLVEWERTYVDISCAEELTRGETVADLWKVTGNEPNCYISKKVNRERFVDLISNYMGKPYISKGGI